MTWEWINYPYDNPTYPACDCCVATCEIFIDEVEFPVVHLSSRGMECQVENCDDCVGCDPGDCDENWIKTYAPDYHLIKEEYDPDRDCCPDFDADDYGFPATDACLEVEDDCDDTDSDVYPGAMETCDGIDSDCNAGTADGIDEAWLGDDCDGGDSDLCEEGVYECTGGAQSCTDDTGDTVDVCDGLDNDCNVGTADGSDEAWLGDACDGGDADLCEEGVYECSGGAQSCTDDTGDTVEACDGIDNDCDGALPADEADDDSDGFMVCEGDCDDTSALIYPGADEVCDGLDNDCANGIDDGL
ncbi:putative metal-binding motif-containing protein, partial [Thermodesulfobacteriota bacterium]